MKNQFDLLKTTRNNIYTSVKDIAFEQINYIPTPYNNSIGWQVGHVVVTQQLLHYKLSNNTIIIEEELVENLKKGSSGKYILTQKQWQYILEHLVQLPILLEKDYNNTLFTTFETYSTSYGFTLQNIEDAIAFNNLHEAMHLGTINAMKKLIPVFS